MSNIEKLTIGIDGSRNRSGGAVAHLVGILTEGDPIKSGIGTVHVWAYKKLLDQIPNRDWLVKHNPAELEGSMLAQLWWQRFKFPAEVELSKCQIVLNTDAGTVATVRPAVTMSRDMLSYEPGEMDRYGLSLGRLRLIFLRHMQNRSLQGSDAVIFLTHYASSTIQQSCGSLPHISHIPHGVGPLFVSSMQRSSWPETKDDPIRCVYVSNAELYKHQWNVIYAITELRELGYNLTLTLIGGGAGRAQEMLDAAKDEVDSEGMFIEQLEFIPQQDLPDHLATSDLFIFASSCENMPNTLVEGMAMGMPIACSNRGPMPEVLSDGGVYFDPEDVCSISSAIEQLIQFPEKRLKISKRAKVLSSQYSWSRCARETFELLRETFVRVAN